MTLFNNFTEPKAIFSPTNGRIWDVADFMFHKRKRPRNVGRQHSSTNDLLIWLSNAINMLFYSTLASLTGKAWTLVNLWAFLTVAEAVNTDDSTSGGPKCSVFEGVNATFTAWFIAFTAWVAWKRPELSPLIRGTSARPSAADPSAPTPRERTAIKKWEELNTQLYGAVVSHVTASIQSTLHIAHLDDGVEAIKSLKNQFGAQSTGDRAEAMARVQ